MHDAPATPLPARAAARGKAVRSCLVRGECADTALLIRFAISPDDVLVPDLAEKLPGRGLWLTADADCLKTAMAKNMFARAAKQTVKIPPDLPALLQNLFATRLVHLLGLAKKTGVLLLGADGIKEAAGHGKLAAILTARDASATGLADISGRRNTPVITLPLTADALGQALGRDNAVYLGLPHGPQAEAILRDVQRWQGLSSTTAQTVVKSKPDE